MGTKNSIIKFKRQGGYDPYYFPIGYDPYVELSDSERRELSEPTWIPRFHESDNDRSERGLLFEPQPIMPRFHESDNDRHERLRRL